MKSEDENQSSSEAQPSRASLEGTLRAAEADGQAGQPPHVLITKETCLCRDEWTDVQCPVCDGGLAVCANCGQFEAGLDGPCRKSTRAAPRLVNVPERIWLQVGWALAPDTAPDWEVDGEIDFNRIVNEDTTWCRDQIEKGDVEYTRAISHEWQTIETAPKYPEGAQPVLVYGAKRLEWAVAKRDTDDSWLVETCSDIINIFPPTHWMPLPAPPNTQD